MRILPAALAAFAACSSTDRAAMSAPSGASPEHAPHDHASHNHGEHQVVNVEQLARGAALLPGLGSHHRDVTTRSESAQEYFDQGLRLAYAFNHDEAARSYANAALLDPQCAMCWWGVAYTLGPNYNFPMLPGRAAMAHRAIERARAVEGVTEIERALIEALAKRHPDGRPLEAPAMQPRNEAYAVAMAAVADRFPDDDDVQTLAAEAAMNTNPWKLWTPDGQPAPGTTALLARLETVRSRNPNHPGATHFYIHAIEASREPEKGLPAAQVLGTLMPGAGHLVHMPAHIYQRVGQYANASEANRRAIEADRAYLKRMDPPGYYEVYFGHNYGFLAYSASMEGRKEEALAAARTAAGEMPRDLVCGMPGMDFFLSEPLFVMVRFGMWDELVKEPEPDPKYPVLRALWHHAHGMAATAKGQLDAAKGDVAAIRTITAEVPEDLMAGLNAGSRVLELAAGVLEARIAEAERRPDALALWQRAVELEDQLAYNEPADWFYPVRHYYGAALLDAGQPDEAETVFRADLERHPHNGWALFGLWKSLAAQKHKRKEAQQAEQAFRQAWSRADVALARAAYR